tara:strand:+ start:549 stop:809 length:261 start_codon:yes stop_codon:yes gene_type:complete
VILLPLLPQSYFSFKEAKILHVDNGLQFSLDISYTGLTHHKFGVVVMREYHTATRVAVTYRFAAPVALGMYLTFRAKLTTIFALQR